MALFKINKGPSANLSSVKAHEGWAYFTTDDGKLYIDIAGSPNGNGEYVTKAELGSNRILLNAGHADTATELVPAQSKTFTGVIGTAANWANSTFFFGKVLPTSYDDLWTITYKVTAIAAGDVRARATSIFTLNGYNDTYASYAAWNTIKNTSYRPCYYHVYYRAKSAGISNGYGHLMGLRLYSSWNYTTAANARTITVEIIETKNCSFTFFDNMTKYADAPGSGNTNYNTYTEFDFANNGLQEVGDSNTIDDPQVYFNAKTGPIGIWATSLFMEDGSGTYQNICTASDGTLTSSNRTTATTKIANTNGFKLGGNIYYTNTTYGANSSISGYSVVYNNVSLFDSRYAFNTSLTAGSLTAYKPVYLVGTIGTDGLFYLDETWWTQTPNEANKVYVLVGGCYDSTTSNCRMSLYQHNPWYYYDGTTLQPLYAIKNHTHGNITNDGKIGTTTNLAVVTTTNGEITTANLTTSNPDASGSGTAFVATVSQDSKGKLTITRKYVQDGTTSQKGIVQIGSTASTVAAGNHNHNSTYLKLDGSNNMSADVNIITGDTDKFVNFWYDTNKKAGASWRIGMLGTGSSDTNYFVIQSGSSTTTATAWNNTIRIGQNTFDVQVSGNLYPSATNTKTLGTSSLKWANVYATTFTGNLTGNVTGNVSGSSGSCTGNAANVTGVVAIANGGTGATTAAAAWTALGGGASGKHADNYFALAEHNHNSAYLTAVGYDSTNKKIYYTKNGSNTDVVTFGSNAFNSTSYLPLAGGIMTGNIRRYYGSSSTEPMITMLSNNQDIFLWEAGHGDGAAATTTSNHYKLMYKGTGASGNNANYLQLIAHKTDDVVAVQIDEIGNVSLPQMNKGSATKPIYLNNGVITEGTALKDLAYIAKGSGSTKFLREDGTWQTALTSHQSLSAYAKLASPALTGTPTAPTAADGTNNTQIATTAFVMSQFKYNDAMIYKGVVNANSNLPATHYQGWTYKVGTAGTYAGIVCEVGDMIICNTDGTSANNAHWNVIQTNIDGAVIGPSSSTDGNIVLFDGATGKIIKNSTYSPSSFAAASHGTHVTTATVQSALSINTSSGSTSKCLTEKGTFVAFNNYSHPTGDGNLHVPATGTSNNGKFLKAGSTAGSASWSDLPAASDSVAGITKVGASGGAAAYSHGTHVTTSTVQSALSINTSSGSTSKCLTEKGTFVAFNNYSLPLAASGTRGGIQIGYSESGTNYAVKLSSEKAYVSVPWTDTKVTSSSNHYSPTTASGSDKTASASGATAAWSIDVVKGITINTDGKGHITGLSVTSGKIPANPNTDTKVKQSASTTDKWRKVLLHYKDDATSTTAVIDSTQQVYGCVGISAQASTGTLRASNYNVNDKVTLQWNDTDQSLDFVFA